VKPEYLPDLAVQVHVLRRCGLPVVRAEVMHLNSACRFPDLSNLFTRVDVTLEVNAVLLGVPDELDAQRRMLRGQLPDVAIGEHCTKPYECPFLERCWPDVPADHVSSLYRVGRVKALAYEADGMTSIRDLPSDFEMNVIHQRQVRAIASGRMVVEPTLARALVQFASPIAYLDFETVSYAVPRWDGCRPWQNVPVQFSVHIEQGRKRLAHHQWIAQGPEDPRPALARDLVQACAGAECVVAYYASFERDCLLQLAGTVPDLSSELLEIAARLVDLLPVVRNHVYHPDFGGGFSIKQVLPALVPALSYRDLHFQDGMLASLELMRLMQQQERIPPAERTKLRDDLLRYCERDTVAMVKLLERLRGMVGAQLELF
jgi:predicted RecB family nuclease